MAESPKETKKKLLESAKKEFLEKGYMGASLRTIAANAGVTTGAMYRHFKDKDALFCALVDDAITTTLEFIKKSGIESHEYLENPIGEQHSEDEKQIINKFVDYIYENSAPYIEFVVNSKTNLVAYDVILQVADLFNTYLYNIMRADVLNYRRFCIETSSITDKDNDVSDYTCYALVYSLLQSVAKGCVEHIYETTQMNAKFLATKIIHFVETLKTI